jgi:proteasome lid subunit RPN8/RPN11
MSLTLPPEIATEIRRHAEEGFPHEVCGLLFGRASNGDRRAVEAYRLENERPDSRENRYAVSGRSMLRAERHAEQAGLDVVGYYHSHPNAPARPSGYDLDHATWPGISYPIVSVVEGAAVEVRSYTLVDDRSEFVEEPIEEAPQLQIEE